MNKVYSKEKGNIKLRYRFFFFFAKGKKIKRKREREGSAGEDDKKEDVLYTMYQLPTMNMNHAESYTYL